MDRAHYFLRRHRYALKGDIVRFFPSVDHQVLMDILGRRIADPATMRLIGLILQSGEGYWTTSTSSTSINHNNGFRVCAQ